MEWKEFEFPEDFNGETVRNIYQTPKLISALRKQFYDATIEALRRRTGYFVYHLESIKPYEFSNLIHVPKEVKIQFIKEIVERFWNGKDPESNIIIENRTPQGTIYKTRPLTLSDGDDLQKTIMVNRFYEDACAIIYRICQ